MYNVSLCFYSPAFFKDLICFVIGSFNFNLLHNLKFFFFIVNILTEITQHQWTKVVKVNKTVLKRDQNTMYYVKICIHCVKNKNKLYKKVQPNK